MKPSQMTALALRVLAVCIFAWGSLAAAREWIVASGWHGPQPTTLVLVVLLGAPVVLALLLWLLAPLLGRLACLRMEDRPLTSFDAIALGQATLAVAGILLVLSSLPAAVQWIIVLATADGVTTQPHVLAYLMAETFRCLLGVALMLGARRILQWLLALRYIGSPDPAADSKRREPPA